MEERYANVMVCSYLDNNDYEKIIRGDGHRYVSPYYLETVRQYHPEIRIYRMKGGRNPVLIRYDVKVGHGFFCLVASVETYENAESEKDIGEMIESLRSFTPSEDSSPTPGSGRE